MALMTQRPRILVLAIVFLLVVCARTRAEEHAMMSKSAGDTRQPLPLLAMMADHQKQNMREHLAAVQAIIAAIGRDDMDAVSSAASRLGYSEAMGQMCEHMGAAAPGFTPMALNFHHTADTIGEAARRGDRAGVLSALDRTLQTCVGCHATYRQEVVEEETWKHLTAATTSPSMKGQ
jgi:cytochrome c556